MRSFRLLLLLILMLGAAECFGEAGRREDTDAPKRGYEHLTATAYLPPDFDQETFDAVWQVWPEPLRTQAEKATVAERRRLAYSRYGLTLRPDDPAKPLQYVVTEQGEWVMNCFACHGGKVADKVVPGLPNSHFALQTLTEEVRATKLLIGKTLSRMDVGSLFMPLGGTKGTTNAVMFGVVLLDRRTPELEVLPGPPQTRLVHHDMDAPPWWHFKKKSKIYVDGFVSKGHRPLMQFMLVKENSREKFDEWEADFRDVYAYLESIEPPKYPFEIDQPLAVKGEAVFNRHCADCHGIYGADASYPNRRVPIDEVGTDRVRLDSLSAEHRQHYAASWFADFGKKETLDEPGGYVAPTLDGIWASAPYFHNGSVPTLWHVLHPDERPTVWQRTEDGYDRSRVGLEIETFDRVPEEVKSRAERRLYFDTRSFGKSSGGHLFPNELDESERRAVLEYLKTL